MSPRRSQPFAVAVASALVVCASSILANAGPEISLRDFAGGQIKKGVRTIGMGGDGATTGNYAMVYKDAGGAIFDEGLVRFSDTGNLFSFSAVGFTTPTFWDDAAFYVIALAQHATEVHVWSMTPTSAAKPPSVGTLADSSVFVKFAKPITSTLSFGLLGSFELSDALLLPDDGSAPIRYTTSYRPSGGAGLHWHPDTHWQVGARVILSHDEETRTQGSTTTSGLAHSYEYRLGAAYSPWAGTLFDVGGVALQRANAIEGTSTFDVHATIGVEQMLVEKALWLRAGLDETTWTAGASVAIGVVKIDVAYLHNLAAARTGSVFGVTNDAVIATIGFDYAKALARRAPPPEPSTPPAPVATPPVAEPASRP